MTWTSQQTRAQYLAIVRLRWRIFLNGFRRKGSKGDLVSYLILIPLFSLLVLGLAVAAASTAYALTGAGHVEHTAWIFWAIFVVAQLVNINLGQPGTTFDPTQLIRFPLRLGSYTAIRLFFGVLSPGNIIVTLLSYAAALGVVLAEPRLWGAALVAATVFALTNILFTRMVFTWVDRWLSTGRARTVFTAMIFLVSIGFQYLNLTYNPAYGGQAKHHLSRQHSVEDDDEDDTQQEAENKARMATAVRRYELVKPYLDVLPPGLTGNSLLAAERNRFGTFAAETLGGLAYAAFFLGIFTLRMRTEFRGENLSDQANAVAKPAALARASAVSAAAHRTLTQEVAAEPPPTATVVKALLGKEFLYMRRNTGLFYGLVAPLVMVFLFAGRFASRSNSPWIFPAALAYALLGVVPVSFNSFGLDGTGAQFYFLAPIRLRDVLLAKNVLNLLIAAFEFVVIAGLVMYVSGPPPAVILISTVFWVVVTVAVAMTVGNYRSISAPKKIEPNKAAQKQARPLSALFAMGILLVTGAVAWSMVSLGDSFQLAWLAPVVLLVLAAGSVMVYWRNLEGMDTYALQHRDGLFEELGKKA